MNFCKHVCVNVNTSRQALLMHIVFKLHMTLLQTDRIFFLPVYKIPTYFPVTKTGTNKKADPFTFAKIHLNLVFKYVRVCSSFMYGQLPVLVGPLSAIQPFIDPLTFNWATIGNWRSGFPGETISLPVCLQPTYGTQEYQTCTETIFSGWVESPCEIQVYDSNHGSIDLQSTALPLDQRAPLHHLW